MYERSPITGLMVVLSCATLAATGCDTDEPVDDDDDDTTEQEEPFVPPDEPGPHAVGTEQHDADSRTGITLPVQVWFPASEAGEETYLYDGFLEGQASVSADPDCSSIRPVLVFSHGNSGIRYQTWSVMEYLASHGWMVVAPDHVDNTYLDFDMDLWPRIAMRRPWDVADAFDWLVAESADEASDFHGCIDPDAGYAVAGHSFGGFTSFAVAGASLDMVALAAECAADPVEGCDAVDQWMAENPGEEFADHSDPRAWAAVPWAPAWHEVFGGTMTDISVPLMVIGGDRDTLTPWESAVEPCYRELTTTPRYLAGLVDTGHYSFTDFCDLLPGSMNNGCGEDFRPYAEVLHDTQTLTLALLLAVQGAEEAEAYLPHDEAIWIWEAVE
jgi:predicted dienelactone hydrolase